MHDVFISYSRKDYVDEHQNVIPDNEVSKIKEALSKAGITYWFDEDGIYSGQNFVEKIVTNIENAKIFLFLSTVNANKSPWTCKEIASADEFQKHIIPVRIDSSPYNKKVLFRIADLDYIEYYTNPQKGLEDIVKFIKTYLEDLANAERLKEEEENKKKELVYKREEEKKRQKELEEKRRQEEQQRLISGIRSSCTILNNEEAKLELSRENLLIKTEKVSDDEQRMALLDLINNGGTIHKKYQQKYSELTKEISGLKSTEIESLKLELKSKEDEISRLSLALEASKLYEQELDNTSKRLNGQIEDLQKQVKALHSKDGTVKNRKTLIRARILYWIIILFLVGLACFWLNESQSWRSRYDTTWYELQEYRYDTTYDESQQNNAKETLNTIASHIPFIITDVEIKNYGEEWGDRIYSSKSTYFVPRIKYIGINSGTYKLYYKIFDNTGELNYNEETSPKGYSFSDELSIVQGENTSNDITGWGNSTPGIWPAGSYRIEVWYEGKELFEKFYRVYPDS